MLVVDCYYGIGVGYRGNVSITRSGLTCQAWKSQCPHRHWRIPEDVKDGQNDSNNACRNPDSSAPDGPWCYTADPNVRWEYCNVSRCPPRGLNDLLQFFLHHTKHFQSAFKQSSFNRYHVKITTVTGSALKLGIMCNILGQSISLCKR